jgi:RNA polymerase sigma-70 factor, ECF subfamily
MDKKIGEEKDLSAVNNMSDTDSDRVAIEAAQSGDKNAYGQLVLRYQKRIFRFVIALTGRMDTAEDIVQEAFVKGYLALNDFEPEKPFYPWISTIARNLAINHIKKTEREKPLLDADDYLEQTPDSTSNPLDRIIDRENDRRLMQALASLSPEFREVFILRTFEEMSYDEIARHLNISTGTVDSRLHRAREKLLGLLKIKE